jgi:hypothetical protein
MELNYSGVVDVTLARSPRVSRFVAFAWSATVAVVVVTPMPLGASILLVTGVSCLALDSLRRIGRPARLYLDAEGAISVDGRAGTVVDGSFVAPWLAIIHWRPAGQWLPRTLLVAPDMLATETFRQLRVLLRLG